MNKILRRLLGSALLLILVALPAQSQTVDLRFTPTINAGAGTGGLDQLEVVVEMNPTATFGLGTSTIQFTYNTAALAVPSGTAPNTPLPASDYEFIAPYINDGLGHIYTSTATLFGTTDRYSLNVILPVVNLFFGDVTLSVWNHIATVYFDITDNAQTAQFTWIPGTDPNPVVINLPDNATSVTNGIFTDNDYDLDAGLPVELVDFTATTNNGDVVLNWSTASEEGNAGFGVEYSAADSDTWSELAFVEGAGDSNVASDYSFKTSAVGFGTYEFRLRQVNVDGSIAYSSNVEVSIDVPESFILSTPYPNPFNPNASFTLAIKEQQNVRVELYNMLGQMIEVLHAGVLDGNQTHSFDIDGSNLSSGMYLVRVEGDNFSTTKTATLLK